MAFSSANRKLHCKQLPVLGPVILCEPFLGGMPGLAFRPGLSTDGCVGEWVGWLVDDGLAD